MTTIVNFRAVVETALHVLVAWNDGRKPAPADVDILKTAFPSSADLELDDLCCQIIHDLCGRTLQEPQEEPGSHQQSEDEVALDLCG